MVMIEQLLSGCWRWRGRLDPYAHGQFRLDGRVVPAARAAWFLLRNELLSTNYFLRATCETEGCVLPDHQTVVPRRQTDQP